MPKKSPFCTELNCGPKRHIHWTIRLHLVTTWSTNVNRPCWAPRWQRALASPPFSVSLPPGLGPQRSGASRGRRLELRAPTVCHTWDPAPSFLPHHLKEQHQPTNELKQGRANVCLQALVLSRLGRNLADTVYLPLLEEAYDKYSNRFLKKTLNFSPEARPLKASWGITAVCYSPCTVPGT